jgi:hypothetical protein
LCRSTAPATPGCSDPLSGAAVIAALPVARAASRLRHFRRRRSFGNHVRSGLDHGLSEPPLPRAAQERVALVRPTRHEAPCEVASARLAHEVRLAPPVVIKMPVRRIHFDCPLSFGCRARETPSYWTGRRQLFFPSFRERMGKGAAGTPPPLPQKTLVRIAAPTTLRPQPLAPHGPPGPSL